MMDFEDLQKAWQSQRGTSQVTISADMLLKEVRRNQRQFLATIFWRDVREVGVAFLLVIFFLYHAWRHHLWTDYLSALACGGIGLFMVVDRILQRHKSPVSNHTLKDCIGASLAQVNHQIWLLKNVFWWYLLPLLGATVISMVYPIGHARHFNVHALNGLMISALIVGLITWWVYRLNQTAVRTSLEPRRLELEALAANLG